MMTTGSPGLASTGTDAKLPEAEKSSEFTVCVTEAFSRNFYSCEVFAAALFFTDYAQYFTFGTIDRSRQQL